MSWWTAVAALTPVVAHDALTTSGAQALDRVGSNHMGFGGQVGLNYPYYCLAGNSNPMPWTTPVSLPSAGVIAILCRQLRSSVCFYKQLGDGSNYLLSREADQYWRNASGGANQVVSFNPSPFGQWHFVALLKTSTDARLYVNGAWNGNVFAAANLMTSVAGVGYFADANTYNLDADEQFGACGIWSGGATLADMQQLEAAARAAVVGPEAGTMAFKAGLGSRALVDGALQIGAQPVRGFGALAGSCSFTQPRPYGRGYVQGIVKVVAIPAARTVRVYDRISGELVGTTRSSATGSYRLDGLAVGHLYMAVALDDAGNTVVYDAAVKDMIEAGI